MITSLAKVKARAGIAELEIQWDQQLIGMIHTTLDRFNLETRRTLQRTVGAVHEFDAGALEVSLDCYPVESVTRWELCVEGVWQEETEVVSTVRGAGMVLLNRKLGSRNQLARVTYTGGYVLPDPPNGAGTFPLPEILEVAAIETVLFWWQNKDAIGLIRVEGLAGDYKELADTEWIPWVKSTLKHFRRTAV